MESGRSLISESSLVLENSWPMGTSLALEGPLASGCSSFLRDSDLLRGSFAFRRSQSLGYSPSSEVSLSLVDSLILRYSSTFGRFLSFGHSLVIGYSDPSRVSAPLQASLVLIASLALMTSLAVEGSLGLRAECIGGANSSASSGLGEFACGINLDNFAHKFLVKLFYGSPNAKPSSYNICNGLRWSNYLRASLCTRTRWKGKEGKKRQPVSIEEIKDRKKEGSLCNLHRNAVPVYYRWRQG